MQRRRFGSEFKTGVAGVLLPMAGILMLAILAFEILGGSFRSLRTV
jgi:hypothetical protein